MCGLCEQVKYVCIYVFLYDCAVVFVTAVVYVKLELFEFTNIWVLRGTCEMLSELCTCETP